VRPGEADIGALLEGLAEARVEHIVVGGVAAVLHGAPLPTRDLDIVPKATADNLDRLYAFLCGVDAIARQPGSRELPVRRSWLDGQGQVLLRTTLGPLDLLLRLHDGRGYSELHARSVELSAGGLRVRLIDLPTLVEIKASTGRVRDRLAVPLLVALLEGEGPEPGPDRSGSD
jgi:hypothetical protein